MRRPPDNDALDTLARPAPTKGDPNAGPGVKLRPTLGGAAANAYLIIVLLAAIIAQLGFWDTLQAIFGAIGIIVLFWLIVAGLATSVAHYLYRRVRRRF